MGNFIASVIQYPFYGYKAARRWTKWTVSFFFIVFHKRRSRIFKYDMSAEGEPYKTGFFIPPKEWDLECPAVKQEKEQMFFFGINSSGDCLAMEITRQCACDSSSLFLKVDGCTYILPMKFNCLSVNDQRTFGNNRFFVKCLVPFRKWKIFFNGMLRKICQGKDCKDTESIIHVRMSIIWVASSGIFDFVSDYSNHNMADILSDIKWNSIRPPINRLLTTLNEYQQAGMMHGTVQLGSESEQEILLWGCRVHTFVSVQEDVFGNQLEFFGNTEILSSQNPVTSRSITGYIMQPNGSLNAVTFKATRKVLMKTKTVISFKVKAGGFHYNVSAFSYGCGASSGKGSLTLTLIDVAVDGIWGSGIIVERIKIKRNACQQKCKEISTFLKNKPVSGKSENPFVMNFDDPLCLDKRLSGNLGSTSAKIMQMKDQISGYDMPAGFVVTTVGYQDYISQVEQSLHILKENILKYNMDELKLKCKRITEEISNCSFSSEFANSLKSTFKMIPEEVNDASFNIYPSLTGSNTEIQLLEAYLDNFCGIKGLSKVTKFIKKCWASQFSHGAIQCKRSCGLSLNIPMAVIVQKNVPFHIRGIISSCESSTGNPSILEIREDYLKEKKSLEISPTQITRLKRDFKNNLLLLDRNVIQSNENNSGSNESNDMEKDTKELLSDKQALFLGKLACKLETQFEYPFAMEWCLSKKKFFLIQVRPIILVNMETDSEILTYYDTYIRSEDEWISGFASGEVFLGPISPLGMNLINFCLEVFVSKMKLSNFWNNQWPYFPKFLVCSQYHMMHCMADGILQFSCLFNGLFYKSLSSVLNLKPCVEELLFEFIYLRHGYSFSLKTVLRSIFIMLQFGKISSKLQKKIEKYDLDVKNVNNASDLFHILSGNYQDIYEPFACFMICTYKAVLWSMIIFYILERNSKDTKYVHKDFNFLMASTCMTIEDNIAADTLTLSKRIAENIDPQFFKMMSTEDALQWLKDSEIDKKIQFSDFLKKHGHRCFKEMDIFQKNWSMDPVDIVHVLQVVVPNSRNSLVCTSYPLDSIFHQLPEMPNFFQRLLLKNSVSNCVSALKEAKRAKSNLLKIVSIWRQAFHKLASNAVKEFKVPFTEALFYLDLEEIHQLLKSESPNLVTKATRCWEVQSNLCNYVFPIIAVGFPFPLNKDFYVRKRLKVGSHLSGCPMSRGTAVGTAVVITNFSETATVEKGCILITRSPSIVWSLYFPVIGGFAADFGGILSDGAILAREYGIPCVINLVRASQIVKTGDRVFLDSNVGILRRLSSD